MSTLFALPLVFAVLCSVEEVPLWVDKYGPDGAELYKRASLLGIKEDTLQAFMGDSTAPHQPPDAMMRHTETWRAEGVDLIKFLQEIVEDDVLRSDRENRVLYAIVLTRDDDAIDWAISHVRKNLSNPIRTQHDTTRMMGLVWALGKTKRDEALDIVLKLQSKAFWSGEGAPEVDMEPFGRWTAEEVNSQTIQEIRSSAFTQISILGTERAVEILGTGEGIAPDLQGRLDSAFQRAVRRHVGVYSYPEKWGRELSEETLAEIERICAKYGKTYEPIEYDREWHERALRIGFPPGP